MKKSFLSMSIGLVLLLALISPVLTNNNVQAQVGGPGCVDAAGVPIECTPTPDGGNQSSTARPSKTPFPLANPTQEASTAGVSWSGSCANAGPVNDPCLLKLVNACYDAGGDSTVGDADENGTVTVTCALPAVRYPNAQPPLVAAPTQTALPDENYVGSCSNADGNVFDCFDQFKCEDGLLVIEVDLYADGGTKYDFYCIPDENIPQLNLPLTIPDPAGQDDNWTGNCNIDGLDACLDLASSDCSEQGGELSVWYDEDGAGVYCQNQSEAGQVVPTATALAVVALPEDNSTAGEDWDESCSWASCFAYDIMCWSDGGSGYGQDDGAGNTVYHCDLPEGSTSGQSNNNLKRISLAVFVIVVLLLAIPALIRARGKHIKKATLFVRKAGKETADYGKEDDGESIHRLFGDSDGDTSGASKPKPKPKPTPPPPPPSQPSSSDLDTWQANYGSSGSQGKPKPKPSKGDFDSDGDVDGRDFNP